MASRRFYRNYPSHPRTKTGSELTRQQRLGRPSRHAPEGCKQRLRSGALPALLASVLATLSPFPVWAWNDFGHMVVAAVAWAHLDPGARQQATRLLRLNPDYPRWIAGIDPQVRDVTAFLHAATWPDAIKREPGYLDDGERPTGADATRNSGYDDPNEHRYWHFVDVPFSTDGTPLPDVPFPNAASRVSDFRQILADPTASSALKSYDLTWLMHLVGDLHQPLHATSRFTHEQPQGDLGGNRVRLCDPPCREDLHYFWDRVLGRGTPVEALALSRHLPDPAPQRIADTNIEHWVQESGVLARSVVYVAPIGAGSGPYALTEAYRDQARALARERIALAGRRLAVLLNAALAPGAAPRRAAVAGAPR